MKTLEFRVGGIPVRVEPIFFLVLAVLGWGNGRSGWTLALFMVVGGLSILVHELGHATAQRSFGARPRITLTGFGGYTLGPVQPRGRSLVVTLAGPAAGFLAAVLGAALSQVVASDSPVVETALADLVWLNVAWGVFNLLPILPLDGGHVAADLFGIRPARILSVVGAVALGVVALYLGAPVMAFLALYFGSQSAGALRSEQDKPQLEQLDLARGALLQNRSAEAIEKIEPVAASPSSFPVEVMAGELLAWCHLTEGRPEQARQALDRLRGGVERTSSLVRRMVDLAEGKQEEPLAPAFVRCNDIVAAMVAARMVSGAGVLDRVLEELRALPANQAPPRTNGYRALQLGLHHAARFRDAARVGEILFEEDSDPLVAYNVACSWALARETEHALAWLDRAVEKGFRDTTLLDQDNNFDLIRETDGFRALRSWMEAEPPGDDSEQAAGGTS